MIAGDFHGITVFASPPNEPDNFRVTGKYVGAVSSQSVAFGPIVNAATTSLVSGGTYPRYRFQGALPTEYNKAVGFFAFPEDEGNEFSAYATSAYLAATFTGAGIFDVIPALGSEFRGSIRTTTVVVP